MDMKRLHYIDWLRVLVILSLIPFHAALTYTRYGSVYIKEPVSGLAALPFLIISVPLGDFFMTLMFFVSGVASYYSFKKRGSGEYIGERALKLMVPFGLGFCLLCPEPAYFMALHEGYQGNFISFLPQFFWYKLFDYPGYGHLWFLLYLFVFSVFCTPLFRWWQRDGRHIERIGAFLSQGHRLLLPVGFVILLELCLRPFFHTGAYVIVGDWANDAVYLSMFVFGYVYAAEPRIQEKIRGYFKVSAVFGSLSLVGLFYTSFQSQVLYSDGAYLTLIWVLAKGAYECSAIIFLLNFGRLYLNRKSRALGYLNKTSFTIYLFHFLPVTFFTWLLIDLEIHIFLICLMVVVLSYITVFLICELWRRAAWGISATGNEG